MSGSVLLDEDFSPSWTLDVELAMPWARRLARMLLDVDQEELEPVERQMRAFDSGGRYVRLVPQFDLRLTNLVRKTHLANQIGKSNAVCGARKTYVRTTGTLDAVTCTPCLKRVERERERHG